MNQLQPSHLASPNLRLEITEVPPAKTTTFAYEVAAAFSAHPKRPLPPKYFYDDLGSALFEAITYLPDYYLARAEMQIFRDFGRQIVASLPGPLELLELGNGSSIKSRLLIEDALRTQGTLRYTAIDVSPSVSVSRETN